MLKRGQKTPISSKQKVNSKTKRKNIVIPQNMVDNDSLELVASPIGPIRNYAVTPLDKDIIIERMHKEIVDKFYFTLSPPSTSSRTSKRKRVELPPGDADVMEKKLKMQTFAKSSIIVGTNSCTRAFEKLAGVMEQKSASTEEDNTTCTTSSALLPMKRQISLCVLARDIRPASTLSHIPYLCKLHNIPIVLLPGKASHELGKTLGGKKVSVLLFTCGSSDNLQGTEKKWQQQIQSYIDFIEAKIPTGFNTNAKNN